MGTIAAKFGSALQGFWWALDEHERRLLLIGSVWAGLVVLELAAGRERQARRDEVRDWIREEVRDGSSRTARTA